SIADFAAAGNANLALAGFLVVVRHEGPSVTGAARLHDLSAEAAAGRLALLDRLLALVDDLLAGDDRPCRQAGRHAGRRYSDVLAAPAAQDFLARRLLLIDALAAMGAEVKHLLGLAHGFPSESELNMPRQ